MTDFLDKFHAFFFTVTLLGMGFMMYQAIDHRKDCVQSVVAQGYSTADIAKICR